MSTPQKILALVDGSGYSQHVCQFASYIAQKINASVELVHVLMEHNKVDKQDLSGAIRLGARSALLTELMELDEKRAKLVAQKGRAILDDAKALLEKSGVVKVTTRLRKGALVDTVHNRETDADVIIVGKWGEGHENHSTQDVVRPENVIKPGMGSNLERIVRSSHLPIFVVSGSFGPINRVLVAFDGGPSALKAIEKISESDFFKGLTVCLVSVDHTTPDTLKALKKARDKLEQNKISTDMLLIEGEAETVLKDQANSGNYDMIVMGAYGHSRIRSMIIGSTTTHIIQACDLPLLLIR